MLESVGRAVDTVILIVMYLIGIGVTALVARVLGKRFLDMEPGLPRWHPSEGGSDSTKMY